MHAEDIFALLDEADVGAYAVTQDQRVVFWSRGAERMLGHRPDDAIGRRCFEFLGGRARGGLTSACAEGCPALHALRDGRIPGSVDVQMIDSSGERQEITVTPMLVGNAPGDSPLLVHVLDHPGGKSAAAGSPGVARTEPTEGGAEATPGQAATTPHPPGTPRIAPRELEVLRLVAQGRSTHGIAEDLGISPHTVRNHVRHFRRKLEARTKLEAVLTAMRLGILDPE